MNWTDDYLKALGQDLGAALALGAEGTASLDMGQGVVLHLEAGSEHLLHCYAVLGTADATDLTALYERLLSAQFFGVDTGSASFALDAQRRELLLMQRIDVRLQGQEPAGLSLRAFADLAGRWTQDLAVLSKPELAPADAPSADSTRTGWLAA